MNLKTQKIAAGVLVGLTVIAGGYSWWSHYGPYDYTKGEESIRSESDYFRYWNSLRSAYKSDDVGFATPEKTFNAFREALKSGDYELAASYFVPEKKQEIEEFFERAEKEEFIDQQIQLLYLPNKEVRSSTDLSVTYTASDGAGHNFGYRLIKNEYTGIWKMLSL